MAISKPTKTQMTPEIVLQKVETAFTNLEAAKQALNDEYQQYLLTASTKKAELSNLDEQLNAKTRSVELQTQELDRNFEQYKKEQKSIIDEELTVMRVEKAVSIIQKFDGVVIKSDEKTHYEKLKTEFESDLTRAKETYKSQAFAAAKAEYEKASVSDKMELVKFQATVDSLQALLEAANKERDRAFEQLNNERKASVDRNTNPVINFPSNSK
jgi:hypothetical protein